jgi:hypothetical protein
VHEALIRVLINRVMKEDVPFEWVETAFLDGRMWYYKRARF